MTPLGTFHWHLWPRMLDRGWTRPADLHRASMLSKPACARLLADAQPPIGRLDLVMLMTLATLFDCVDEPWSLLEYRK